MSFIAAATTIGFTGTAATIAAGAMMGGTMTVGMNVVQGRDPFDNLGQGMLMGGLTAGISPYVGEALNSAGLTVSANMATGLTAGALGYAATGDIGKGLTAGLSAYGLAELSGNLETAGGKELADAQTVANANAAAQTAANASRIAPSSTNPSGIETLKPYSGRLDVAGNPISLEYMDISSIDNAAAANAARSTNSAFTDSTGRPVPLESMDISSVDNANAANAAAKANAEAYLNAERIEAAGNAVPRVSVEQYKQMLLDKGMSPEEIRAEFANKGKEVVGSDLRSAGKFLKANAKNLLYAASPIFADAEVQSKMPQTVTKPGMIRPYSFDPYGGTYTAGVPYEAAPTRAAGGGLMGMADGGYSPGQLDFTQRSEPVVRMASGGIAALAAGGPSYIDLSRDSSADQIASAYKAFTDASGGNTQQNQAAAIDYLTGLGINQDKINEAYGKFQAGPTYTNYTTQNILDYTGANKDIDIAAAAEQFNADPRTVAQAINSLGAGYLDPTDTKGGSGAFQYYDAYTNAGINAKELYDAKLLLDPNYSFDAQTGAAGLAAMQRAFDVAKQFDTYKYGTVGNTELEKDVAFLENYDAGKFAGTRAQQIEDIARETGLSLNEAKRRYDAARASMAGKPITCPTGYHYDATTKSCVKNVDVTQNTTTTVTTPTNISTAASTALPVGVSGAGITTINPNGTITTRPDLTLGMGQVRDDYVRGGGRLGYIPYAPKTIEEFNTKYVDRLTGGSRQSYDYLTGKKPYDPTPYTPTGEIMKPYAESVGRAPVNLKTRRYIFDPETRTYKENPAYVKPSYVLAAEKAVLSNPDKEPTTDPGAGKKWVYNTVDKKWEAKSVEEIAAGDTGNTGNTGNTNTLTDYEKLQQQSPGGFAAGGLAAMARGGMSSQYNLGGYSDGGRLLRGPGDGVSDSIPATIGNKRPARLADGEFVVPARIVSELGNGSTEAGARKLYAMMERVQAARRGTVGKKKVAKNSRADRYLPA
jgi:hypothetical protein